MTICSIDDEITLLCAFDYAVGRKTYVVASVCNVILENIRVLKPKTIAHIHDEIGRRQASDELGHDMDKERWLQVRRACIQVVGGH